MKQLRLSAEDNQNVTSHMGNENVKLFFKVFGKKKLVLNRV
jgi:hypothetical protein